jgi:ATP-dependent Clp protease ATP-binding subunit ClpC
MAQTLDFGNFWQSLLASSLYTDAAKRVLFFARYEAALLGCVAVEPEHLLLGVIRERKDLLVTIAGSTAAIHSMHRELISAPQKQSSADTTGHIPLGFHSQTVIAQATTHASKRSRAVNLEDILVSLLQSVNCAAQMLKNAGIDKDKADAFFASRNGQYPPPR